MRRRYLERNAARLTRTNCGYAAGDETARQNPVIRLLRVLGALVNLGQDFLINDKQIINKWVHYFPIYERHFSAWRNKSLNVSRNRCAEGRGAADAAALLWSDGEDRGYRPG